MRLGSKLLMLGMLVSTMCVGCSSHNLDTAADKLETDLISYREDNIKEYGDLYYLSENQSLAMEIAKSMKDIDVEITEEGDNYKVIVDTLHPSDLVDTLYPYDLVDTSYPSDCHIKHTILVSKDNSDLVKDNFDLVNSQYSEDVQFVAREISVINNLSCVSGYNGYNEENSFRDDKYDDIDIHEEASLRQVFYGCFGDITQVEE